MERLCNVDWHRGGFLRLTHLSSVIRSLLQFNSVEMHTQSFRVESRMLPQKAQ